MLVKHARMLSVLATFCITASTLVGCGGSSGGLEKAGVSGKITYQGKPVEDGEIRLVPIKGTKGPASSGIIKNGEYAITARGGVPVGTHSVEIQAYLPIPGARPYTAAQADGQWDIKEGDLPKKQILPYQYNRKSTLELTIEPDAGSVSKNFDLR